MRVRYLALLIFLPLIAMAASATVEILSLDKEGETVSIFNDGSAAIDMTGWYLNDDEADPHTFTFSSFQLGPWSPVYIHTGIGQNTSTDLYWGRVIPGGEVWDNTGDIATLYNAQGIRIADSTGYVVPDEPTPTPTLTIIPIAATPTPILVQPSAQPTFVIGKQYAIGDPGSFLGAAAAGANKTAGRMINPRGVKTPDGTFKPGTWAYGITPPNRPYVRWYPAARWGTGTYRVAPTSTQRPRYIIGIDGAYPPYTYQGADGSINGFDVDSARWIANKMGFEVEFKAVAWGGIIPALQAKQIDMIYSGMTITEERKQQVAFSKPYLRIDQALAARSDSTLTFDDIMSGKVVIGTQRGTTGEMWVQDNLIATGKMPAANLKSFDNFPLAITALMNKQVDATVYDKPPTVDLISGKNAKIIHEIDTGERYGIAIRKEDAQLLDIMNQGLDLLMADPYWNQLKVKYNLSGT